MTDSSTGGYIAPSSSAPATDAALEDLLHDLVVGCTGLDGTMVRPRWQAIEPKQPEPNVNWCAVGVQSTDTTGPVSLRHIAAGQGTDELSRQEIIEVVASFYGPNGQGNASLMRDMLAVPQNNEAIEPVGMVFVESAPITPAPALINQQWVRKYDLRMKFRRQIVRTLPTLNVLSAQGEFLADDGLTQNFTVGP